MLICYVDVNALFNVADWLLQTLYKGGLEAVKSEETQWFSASREET